MSPSGLSAEQLKRRVYLFISGLAVLSALIGLIFCLVASPRPLWMIAVLAGALLYHTASGLGLWSRRLSPRHLEVSLIFISTATTFALLSRGLYGDYPSTFGQYTVMSMYLWLPLIYLFSFFALDVRRALPLSLGVLALVVAVTLPHGVLTLGGRGPLDGFTVLGNVYLSHSGIISVVYFLATFQRRLQRAEVETRRMQQLAYTDGLTGVANRRQLEQLITDEIARKRRYNRPFSVVLIDIDDFKRVNDSFGHDVGDEVLKELVARVVGNVRASDQVGRWGGEEFLILAPETGLKEAMALAEHVGASVRSTPLLADHALTVSLGVATFSEEDSVVALIKRADEALYRAKRR